MEWLEKLSYILHDSHTPVDKSGCILIVLMESLERGKEEEEKTII